MVEVPRPPMYERTEDNQAGDTHQVTIHKDTPQHATRSREPHKRYPVHRCLMPGAVQSGQVLL